MDERDLRVCRRCFLLESGEGDMLEQIKEKIRSMPEADKTKEMIYRHRLEICGACDHLVGGTCLKCGCYPEFRAAFKIQTCPAGKWSETKS